MKARAVVVGLGPIGREMVRALVGRKSIDLVGAADPVHAGKDVGELAGVGKLNIAVQASAKDAYKKAEGNVAVLCTTSRVKTIGAQAEEAVAAGYGVVSTCEELSW